MRRWGTTVGSAGRETALVLLILALGGTLTALTPYFLNLASLLNLTQFTAVLGLLGLGQFMVILGGGGGIDLSCAGNLNLSGVLMALLVQHHVSTGLAAIIAVLAGIALGTVNAVVVVVARVPALIATLATYYAYDSLALGVSGGASLSPFPSGFAWLGQGYTFGVPNQVLFVLLPVLVLVWVALRWSLFGRSLYAVGQSERAATLAGVRVARVRFWTYVIMGALAGLAAVVSNSWFMSATPDVGDVYLLESIAVVVLGGIDIFGGVGRASGFILSLILVTLIESGLQLANISSEVQLGLLGLVLIGAVVINQLLNQARFRETVARGKARLLERLAPKLTRNPTTSGREQRVL